MGRAGSGQTTVPSKSGRGARGVESGHAIYWLFPQTDVTALSDQRVLLGRGDDCTTVLPGRETSRHHAEIRREGTIQVLCDLASRNGVFVNGRRRSEAPLSVGDVIRLGEWVGLFDTLVEGHETRGPRELAPNLLGGARLRAAVGPALQAAATDLPIVVEGETGTGKECVARAVHEWSGRSGEFVAVNCAALPESLAEAELFGHRKGAFTGATRDSPGYFRAAHGGTLLLDEIVDLPAAIQAKLLRVIERGEVVPLGDTRPIPVDVRLVAAAQSPLRQAVAEKRFRADLLARLDGVSVALPPLRERQEDVPGLFLELISRHSGGHPPRVDTLLIERLCLHDWPYNVRELVQLVRRLLALHAREPVLTQSHLSSVLSAAPRVAAAARDDGSAPRPPAVGRRERRSAALLERLTKALERHAGNVSKAAAAIGISRQRAYRLLRQNPEVDLEALRIPESSVASDDE